jgi:hypothetical protein
MVGEFTGAPTTRGAISDIGTDRHCAAHSTLNPRRQLLARSVGRLTEAIGQLPLELESYPPRFRLLRWASSSLAIAAVASCF